MTKTRKKSWTDRLEADAGAPVIKPAPISIAGMKKGQIMVVPTAGLVERYLRHVPAGKSIDVQALRQLIAKDHGAEVCCPIYTGFHMRTIAEAMWEKLCQGVPISRLTPVWRALPPGSPTLRKLSFDTGVLRDQRAAEGIDETGP
jgi:hypothetical protein